MTPLSRSFRNLLLSNCRLLIKQERDRVRVTAVDNNTNQSVSVLVSYDGVDRLPIIIDELNQAIKIKIQ